MDQISTMCLSWLNAVQNLGDAERGRLLTGMLEYAGKQETTGLRGNERFVFESMKADLDAFIQGLCDPAQNLCKSALYINKENNIQAQPSEEGTKSIITLPLMAMFEVFWKAYPTHVNRKRCIPLWEKIRPNNELLEKMLKSIEAWKHSRQWREGYIPNPDTWLRNEKWNDDVPGPLRDRKDYGYGNFEQRVVRMSDLSSVTVDFEEEQ